MILSRQPWTKNYADGRVEKFNPLLRWIFQTMSPGFIAEISIRGDYGVGVLCGYTIGNYSIYRTFWISIFGVIVYVHAGITGPHNPLTGEKFK